MERRPEIQVPLDEFVRQIATEAAREAARCVLEEHRATCPIDAVAETQREHSRRLGRLELRFVALVAFMAGSGLLGGLAGALISRALGG